jgi:hypothetical protein
MMTVRPFDWRDITTLHRLRNHSIFLDSALVLTRGPTFLPGALVAYLAPAMGVYTCVLNGEPPGASSMIGQIMHVSGSQFVHLTFLTPQEELDSPEVLTLLEHLVQVSGERGAFRLLADVDEGTPAFEALRRCGFAIFSRQRIWQLTGQAPVLPPENANLGGWRTAKSVDAHAIRMLYNNIVPGLVQQVEPVTQRPKGLVSYQQDELAAYVELKIGQHGIWLQPFVHPDAQDVPERLIALLNKIPNRHSRPAYICVRSYQSWLESAVEDLGAEVGPRQAVMVRSLVMPQKASRAFAMPVLEGGQPEITAPIARSESK